jgi:Ca2+-binding RTX toxin-like protein
MSATQTTRKALYVFDSGIPDLQKLLAGLGADQRVAILDSCSDGVLQLADALSGESGLDAIHLFSHGSAGSLWLGSTVLDQANLSGYSAALAQIGSALSDSGDLLLYGCNVAQGNSGQAFIEQLAKATGADVAASTNLTGATALGGDWVLEFSNGSVDTATVRAADFASTLGSTQTQSLNLSLVNQSLWSDDAGVNLSHSFDEFVVNVDDAHYGSSVSGSVAGASIGLDYALNMTGTKFGIPIELGISGGVFNLNYPVFSSIALPSSVHSGDQFSILTGFSGVASPSMTIAGPSVSLSAKIMFQTNLSGHLGLEWSGIPFVDNGAVAFFGDTTDGGQSYTDSTIPVDISKELVNFSPSGGAVLNQNLALTEAPVGGRKVFHNPFMTFDYDLTPGKLEGTADLVRDANGLVDMVSVISPDDPWVSVSFDIDDIAGKILEWIPATKMAGEAVSRLDAEYRVKRDFLGIDLGSDYEAGLASLTATVGLKPAIKVEFDAQDTLATLTANTGESHTGHLGDSFSFSSPSSGEALSITSSYQLVGSIKTTVGLVVTGSIEAKFVGIEGNIFGLDIPAFFTDGIDDGTEADNYLAQFTKDWDLAKIFPPELSLSHAVTYNLGASTTYNINYGENTDLPVLNLPSQPTTLSVSLLGGADDVLGGYSVNEGDDGQATTVTFRITRAGNTGLATVASYSFSLGSGVDAADFVGGLPANGSVIFGVGQTTRDISLVIAGDKLAEIDETLKFNLNSVATVNNPVTTLTIYSDDQLKVVGSGVIYGSSRNEWIEGSAADDLIFGGAGNDEISSLTGSDFVLAGSGNDVINAGGGNNDIVDGGAGNDTVIINSIITGGIGYSRWTMVNGAGEVTASVGYASTYDVITTALASAMKSYLQSYSGGWYNQVEISNVENWSVLAGSADRDLLIVQGTGTTYRGGGGVDALYANWSTATTAISWTNTLDTDQMVNGVTVKSIERLLITTGAGNDRIDNTLGNGNDYIATGDGDDTINAGGGNNDIVDGGAGNDYIDAGSGYDVIDSDAGADKIYAGSGDDTVRLGALQTWSYEIADGGTGDDALALDLSALDRWHRLSVTDSTSGNAYWAEAGSSWETVRGLAAAVADAGGWDLYVPNYSVATASVRHFEHIDIVGSAYDDLILYHGGTHYDGGAGNDTFYADFSGTAASLHWDADANSINPVDGITVANMERFLLASGSGDDVFRATQSGFSHHIESGAGNDRIELGTGSDYVDAGSGDDTVRLGALQTWSYEIADGGTGDDALALDLSALDRWHRLSVTDSTSGNAYWAEAGSSWETVRGLAAAVADAGGWDLYVPNYSVATASVRHLEHIDIVGSAYDDLILYHGGTHYDGGAGNDTFYADFSGTAASLHWDADANSINPVDGITVANMERFLLASGSGDDVFRATQSGFSHHIESGAGNDRIELGTGSDYVDAGSGDDTVRLGALQTWSYEIADGGTGDDALALDLSALDRWHRLSVTDSTSGNAYWAEAGSSWETVRGLAAAVADAGGWDLYVPNYSVATASVRHLEHIDIVGSAYDDLILYHGGTHYDGGAGNDTFYADFSGTAASLHWDADANSINPVDGITVANMERFLLASGSGDDVFRATQSGFSHHIESGAGNDRIELGTGSDYVDAGSGDDAVRLGALQTWSYEIADGGTGDDALALDLSALDRWHGLSVTDPTSGNTYWAEAGSSWETVRGLAAAVAAAGGWDLYVPNYSVATASVRHLEHIDIVGSAYDDLILYHGGTHYDGGAGNDTFYADWSSSSQAITWNNLPAGTLTVNGVTVSGLERLFVATGGGADLLRNFSPNTDDYFDTGSGRDTLDGGGGADTLVGGDGSDTYYVDNVDDQVIESNSSVASGGSDTVCSSLSTYTLTDYVENLRLLSTGAADGIGNGLDNTLDAGTGDNRLDGGAGTDTVSYAYGLAGTTGVTVSLAVAPRKPPAAPAATR